jgi:succinate dehydrogenase / fumarate reductase cytochrome b subunit
MDAPSATSTSTFSFWWSRSASFLALLPLGVWTFFHLLNNLAAFSGAEAWKERVTDSASPVAQALGLILVFVPLIHHTVWGLQRLASARPNTYGTYGNLKYWLQRVTAVGLVFFLGAHVWLALLSPRLLEGHPEQFDNFARTMRHHLPTLVVYVFGTLGLAYHLANGVSTFGWTFGLVAGRGATAKMDKVAIVLFLLLLTMAWGAIYAVYSAGGALSP